MNSRDIIRFIRFRLPTDSEIPSVYSHHDQILHRILKGEHIPLSNILTNGDFMESNYAPMASYQKIRRLALATLFRYNGGIVPVYAEKNFDTHFTCNLNGRCIEFMNDLDFTHVLEQASEENLMDENEGILLEIHCGFTNNFQKNDNLKKFRQEASEAANNALKKLTKWIQKASTAFHKPVVCGEGDMDYVVVGDQNGSCVDDNEMDKLWASRLIRFLASRDLEKREVKINKSKYSNEEASLIENVFDGVISFANELFTEICYRNGDFFSQLMHRHHHSNENLNLPRNLSFENVKFAPDENVEMKNKDEIMFHPADEQAPEEWKIFFSGTVEKDTVFVCESVEADSDDAILIHGPSLEDVKSITSDDRSGCTDDDAPDLEYDDQNSDVGSNVSSCENWEML